MTSYQWLDANKHTVKATADDGSVRFIPTDPANTDYAEILEKAFEIEEPPPQPKEQP